MTQSKKVLLRICDLHDRLADLKVPSWLIEQILDERNIEAELQLGQQLFFDQNVLTTIRDAVLIARKRK
jgi:hypothetical protein